MTSREIIKQNLSGKDAGRFGMNFGGDRWNDFRGTSFGPSAVWTKKTWTEGDTEFYTDEWGNTWHRLAGMSAKGEIYKGGLKEESVTLEGPKPEIANLKHQNIIKTATNIYVNLAEPDLAEEVAKRNVDGVGLLRAEFMIAQYGIHPRKILKDKKQKGFS